MDVTTLSKVSLRSAYALPFESARWAVRSSGYRSGPDAGSSSAETFGGCALTVTDARGRCLGLRHLAGGAAIVTDSPLGAAAAILDIMLQPDCGRPRRPLALWAERSELLPACAVLFAKGVVVAAADVGAPSRCACRHDPTAMRACARCAYRAQRALLNVCPGCRCALYCSTGCLDADRRTGGGLHTAAACSELSALMEFNAALLSASPPGLVAFAAPVVGDDFGAAQLRDFLSEMGVRGAGLWRREEPPPPQCCPRCDASRDDDDFSAAADVPYGELGASADVAADPYVLPRESGTLEESPRGAPPHDLCSWCDYYEWRGLPLASPIAALLQYALTLYRVMVAVLPARDDARSLPSDGSVITVLVLGVEKEADYWPTFAELGHLLAGRARALTLYLIGPRVSPAVSGRVFRPAPGVQVALFSGCLDAFRQRNPDVRADLAVGFNAGVAAYASWRSAVEILRAERVPTFFTEYCMRSASLARAALSASGLGTTSQPRANPFRGPFRRVSEENELLQFSNAVVFHVIFDGSVSQ